MRELSRYINVNIKRMLKLLPVTIIGTAVLCISLLVAAGIIVGDGVKEEQRKLVIGVVGDFGSSFFDSGVGALQTLDSTRYIIELESVTRKEAEEGYADGKYIAYIIIPDGFMESVSYGRNDKKLEYVYGDDVQDIMGKAMAEIVESFSGYVTGSQSGIYASGRVNYELGNGDLSDTQLVDINTRYLSAILNREKMCEEVKLGVGDELSMPAYYFCGMLVFFVFLAGINSCLYFGRRDKAFRLLCISRGYDNKVQLIGEYIPFLIMGICVVLCAWIFISIAVILQYVVLDEWSDGQIVNLWMLMPKLLPVIIFVTVIQFLIYEITDNIAGSILLQFLISVVMGYISGCFYPLQFFPEIMQITGDILPTGVARTYIASCIRGEGTLPGLFLMAVYTCVCVLLIYIIRCREVINAADTKFYRCRE